MFHPGPEAGKLKLIERQKNETIVIGSHLRVTVLEVHDDEVIVSIESDEDPTFNRIETLRVAKADAELELAGAFA